MPITAKCLYILQQKWICWMKVFIWEQVVDLLKLTVDPGFFVVYWEAQALLGAIKGVETQQSDTTGTCNVYSLFIHTYIKHNSCDLVNAIDQGCKGLGSKK